MEPTKNPLGTISFDWTDSMRSHPQDQFRICAGLDLITVPSDSFSKGRTATLVVRNSEGQTAELVKGDFAAIWGKHQPTTAGRKAFTAIRSAVATGAQVDLELLEVRPGRGTSKVATGLVKF